MAQYDKGSVFLNLIISKQHRDRPPQQARRIHSEKLLLQNMSCICYCT
jgi:hypothetical protein